MGSESQSSSSYGKDSIGRFTEFQRLLSHLLTHPEASPFNPTQLAGTLHISTDHIIDYFQAVHTTFELFKTLEQQHAFKWKHVVQASAKSEALQMLTISLEDMQNFFYKSRRIWD